MSRILRRPMFRGGRVSSYGTGIASGLADGGRVGYWKDQKGGMVSTKSGKDIFEAALNRSTYYDPGALPGYTSVKRALPIPGMSDTDYLVSKGYASDVEGPVDENMSMAELIDMQIGEKGDVYQTGSILEDAPREVTSIMDLDEDERIKVRTGQADATTGAIDKISTRPQIITGESKDDSDLEFKGLEGDNPNDYDSSDLESMISNYEDLLGMKKAKGEKYSNMALRLAAAKGDTTMEKLQNWFGMEEKAEDETAKIKQTAALLGIKGEQAQKLYETKLTNTKGMFTKKVEEIMNTEGVSRSEAIRLALGNEATIGAAYMAFKGKTGMPPTPQEFDMMAEEYTLGPLPEDYKTSKPTGTYYIPGEMVIVEMVEGVAKTKKPYKPQ